MGSISCLVFYPPSFSSSFMTTSLRSKSVQCPKSVNQVPQGGAALLIGMWKGSLSCAACLWWGMFKTHLTGYFKPLQYNLEIQTPNCSSAKIKSGSRKTLSVKNKIDNFLIHFHPTSISLSWKEAKQIFKMFKHRTRRVWALCKIGSKNFVTPAW